MEKSMKRDIFYIKKNHIPAIADMVVYLYVWRAYSHFIVFNALSIFFVIFFSISIYTSCHSLNVDRSSCHFLLVSLFRLSPMTCTRSIITSLCIFWTSIGSLSRFSKYLLWRSWRTCIASGETIYFPFISLLYDLIPLLWHLPQGSRVQWIISCVFCSTAIILFGISCPPSPSLIVWWLEGFDMCLPSLSCIIYLWG